MRLRQNGKVGRPGWVVNGFMLLTMQEIKTLRA